MFISKHRRFSQQLGSGVQYLPGHEEPFVDLVINGYLPKNGELLDLGGGGLRFAIPVALLGRSVIVVDLDPSGLDVRMVVNRMNTNDQTNFDWETLEPLIGAKVANVLDYLREDELKYSLICAFRVAHFLRPTEISELFKRSYDALENRGRFVLSAMTPYNLPGDIEFNEVFDNSRPVSENAPLYREFLDRPAAAGVRKQQNLSRRVHLLDSSAVADFADEAGFAVVVDGFKATRIVSGFILEKRP